MAKKKGSQSAYPKSKSKGAKKTPKKEEKSLKKKQPKKDDKITEVKEIKKDSDLIEISESNIPDRFVDESVERFDTQVLGSEVALSQPAQTLESMVPESTGDKDEPETEVRYETIKENYEFQGDYLQNQNQQEKISRHQLVRADPTSALMQQGRVDREDDFQPRQDILWKHPELQDERTDSENYKIEQKSFQEKDKFNPVEEDRKYKPV